MDENGEESTEELHFFYDAQSRPAFVEYEGAMYRYVHNLQGDIVAIVDTAGNLVVEYKYDAWGKSISTTGSLKTSLGQLNPFRYRGYVYDEETELYYLYNRYYDGYCVETNYMREEAKTIYDELYNARAYISTSQRLLSHDIENLTFPFEIIVACVLEENTGIDYNCKMYIDKQTNMIVFSN